MIEPDYHAHPALSKSSLDILAKNPAAFKAWLDGDRYSKPSWDFGRSLHLAVFEPEKSAELLDFYKMKNRKETTLRQEYHSVIEIAKKIKDSPVGELIQDGLAEQPYYGRLADIDFKCKVDYIRANKKLILDLKSTRDCTPSAFTRSVLNYRYHVQEVLYKVLPYQNGISIDTMLFIAYEKVKPYNFQLYTLAPNFYARGATLLSKDIGTYLKCNQNNSWGERDSQIITLEYPAWAN